MGREEGENNERQDVESSVAARADKLLPPTHATVDQLSRLIIDNVKKGRPMRTWFSRLQSSVDDKVIEIDRLVSGRGENKTEQYNVVLPDGTTYLFDGDLKTHDTIAELRIDEIAEGPDFENADLLEQFKDLDADVTIGDETRPMEDEDWLMLGALMDQELDAKPIIKDPSDARATRKRLTKRLKHFARDNGEYSVATTLSDQDGGEQLGLYFEDDGMGEIGGSRMQVIHDVDEANNRYALRSVYDISMQGDDRTLSLARYRIDRLADDQGKQALQDKLEEEAAHGLQKPSEEDFREAIALIERFTQAG